MAPAAVARLDARTGGLEQTIQVGTRPSAIAVGRDGVWVANQLDSTVSLIDPTSDSVVLTRAVAGSPSELAAAGAGVWVAGGEGRLTIVRASGQAQTIAVPSPVTALAIRPVGLLVGVNGIGADHRGGTLVAASLIRRSRRWTRRPAVTFPAMCWGCPTTGYSRSQSRHPAPVSWFPTSRSRSRQHRTVGSPTRFDCARMCATGTEHPSAPRTLSAVSSAPHRTPTCAGYLAALPGATACPGARRCDLRAAVIANDHAGTVTLRLSHPDPDLLTALGQPAFAPDPGGRGIRPGTGPYRVARQVLGHMVDFERNPTSATGRLPRNPPATQTGSCCTSTARPPADVAAVLGAAPTGRSISQPPPADEIELRSPWPLTPSRCPTPTG